MHNDADNEGYDPRHAEYTLRDALAFVKGEIDLLYLGLHGHADDPRKLRHISAIKAVTDDLYSLLHTSILEKANRVDALHRSVREDLQVAKRIQQKILSCTLQPQSAFQYCIRYLPLLEVGGDFYTLSEVKPGLLRCMIADATGHGVQAALITMLIKSEYEKLRTLIKEPWEILEILNQEFYTNYKQIQMFFTAFICDIDLEQGCFSYASAGHPAQYLLQGETTTVLPSTGIPIGIDLPFHVRQETCPLKKPARLLLLTDGAYEIYNDLNEEYGEERFRSQLERHRDLPLQDLVPAVLEAALGFSSGKRRLDDITIVGIDC